MKKIQLYLIVLLAVALLGVGSIPAAATMIGNWKFNEGSGNYTSDSSGFGNTANLSGAVFSPNNSVSGYGVYCNGASCVGVPEARATMFNFTASSDFTIEAWVYVPGVSTSWQGVITKGRDNGSSSWYGIWISSDNRWVGGSASGNIYGSTVVTQKWHHVALVQNVSAGTFSLYVDGSCVASGPLCSGASSGSLLFGMAGVGEFFCGYLDEVRINNTAFDSATIYQDYLQYAPGKLVWYKFEESSTRPSYFADSSPNGFYANPGVSYGGMTPAKVGSYCVYFYRSGYASAPQNRRFNFSKYDSFTITAWVKLEDSVFNNEWNSVFQKGRDTSQWYGLWITPDKRWFFAGQENGIVGSTVTSGWHYIKLVQKGISQTRYLYVDNVLQGTCPSMDALTDTPFTMGGAFTIDQYGHPGVLELYAGYLDEVCFYNYPN